MSNTWGRMAAGATAALGVLAGAGIPGAAAVPAASSPAHAQIGDFGIDLAARDLSVRPGDDFYHYANGHWLETHHIPPDRTSWGSFPELQERTQEQLRGIIEALPPDAPSGSIEQKVGDYYRAYLDTEAIERLGLKPAQPALEAIAAARSHADLARLMGRPDLDLKSPLRVVITPDQKDPDRYIVAITQSGLGMPDRDYYLKDDAVYVGLRTKYQAHVARLLELAGDTNSAEEARSILDLETQIAKLHWPVAKRRERDLTYNLKTRAELDQLAPDFAWQQLLTADGLSGQQQFVVRELDAVQGLEQLCLSVPVESWRPYLRYHYLVGVANVLPKAFDDEVFDFYGRTLNGQEQQRDRWKRAVAAVDNDLGEAVGAAVRTALFPARIQAQDARAGREPARLLRGAHPQAAMDDGGD